MTAILTFSSTFGGFLQIFLLRINYSFKYLNETLPENFPGHGNLLTHSIKLVQQLSIHFWNMPNNNTVPPLPVISGFGSKSSTGNKQLLSRNVSALFWRAQHAQELFLPSWPLCQFLVGNKPLEIQTMIKPTKWDLPSALHTTGASCVFRA